MISVGNCAEMIVVFRSAKDDYATVNSAPIAWLFVGKRNRSEIRSPTKRLHGAGTGAGGIGAGGNSAGEGVGTPGCCKSQPFGPATKA